MATSIGTHPEQLRDKCVYNNDEKSVATMIMHNNDNDYYWEWEALAQIFGDIWFSPLQNPI